MIEISNVSKSYGKTKKIVENVSFKVKDGDIFGFIGPNGAGKTTIIKMITGILEINEGDIKIDQKSISKNPFEAKKNIALVMDNADIFLNLSGIEYLNFIADIYEISKEDRIERIKKWSKKFRLEDVLNNKIQSYSHGMRQKIILIGAFITQAKNLILDEPITGLDPKAIYDLKLAMKEYAAEGNTVFFSTHILDIAENLCTEIAIINEGKIIFKGELEELRKGRRDSLEDIFMEMIDDE